MPNAEGYMTPDEYKEVYGEDPTPYIDQAREQKAAGGERGLIARYGGNIAVGAATAYPSWAGVPETIYAGGQALYNSFGTDKTFMDEFTKSMQVEGAQKNITDHLNAIAARIAQANPGMSEDEVYARLEEYQKSKEFEDFSMTQLKGGIGFTAKATDIARGVVGDERTEAQRDWTDTATEILGSALVGGPAGIPAKISRAAAKNVVSRTLLNNPVSRTAIKAVELTTPVTVPYTPMNVVANAAVGTALDQGLRYARGQDTAFTPKTEESPGVGTIATGAAVVGGMGAFVAAMRGGQRAALRANTGDLVKAMEGMPSVDTRVAPSPKTGEAIITAGPEQQLTAPSALEDAGAVRSSLTRARGNVFDEGNVLLRQLEQVRPEDTSFHEALYRSTSGPVLEDGIRQSTEVATHELFAAINSAPKEAARAAEAGMVFSTLKARYDRIEDALVDKLANMKSKTTDDYKNTLADLKRIRNDKDESARIALPELPRSQVDAFAMAYRNSTDPAIVRIRDAHRAWADLAIQNEVRSGRMSAKYAAELRRFDEFYTPLISDPLGGATGLERVRRSVVRSVKRAQTEGIEGTGSAVARESPIRELRLEVPSVDANLKAETRITTPKNPRSAILEYTINSYRALAHQDARNQFVRWLSTNPNNTKSDFFKDGYMKITPNPRSGKHWTDADKVQSNTDLVKLLNDPRYVPEWQNGRLRLWEFGDPELALAMRHDPVKMSGLMQNVQSFSSWYKYFTTGAGNPIFAVKGALYNIIMQTLFRGSERAYGPLSFWMHRLLPASVAKHIGGMILDPTVLLTLPYHGLAAVTEFMVWAGARKIADTLKAQLPFNAFRNFVGEQKFQAMVKRAVQVAAWTENFATLKMMRGNATHGIRSTNNVTYVRDHYAMIGEQMPDAMRGAYSFYKGLLDSVYLMGSRPYYTQNHYLLAKKYGGADKIPPLEITRLMHETRTVGGDMSIVPASKTVRDIEAWFPYLSQAKLGSYHLARHMFGKETAQYMLPRLAMMTSAMGAMYYWRTYWDDESRKAFWNRPEYDRYRIIDIPAPQLLWSWAMGENPKHNRKLYYSLVAPPDLVPIAAGTLAMMQQMGMVPADATPRPIAGDLPKLWIDSLTPSMPPLLQAALGTAGIKLDPQGSDTRGGNLFRTSGSVFRAGPQAESATNLGQISNSTQAIMSGLFGAMGSYLAASTDILLHASKYHTSAVDGKQTLRQSADFAAGLRAGTGAFVEKAVGGIPDVPLIWQNQDKYRVTTPAWQQVAANNNHIRSIVGIGNDAYGKAGQRKRALAGQVGGMPEQAMTDETLLQVAKVVSQFQNPTGILGKMKQQYRDLSAQNRAISVQYNLPQAQRQERINGIVGKMQDNMQQQHMAVKYLEQVIAANFGQQLAPRMRGRAVTIENLDVAMRESFGTPAPQPDTAQAQEQ